jgi:hypothetical protein
MSGQDTLADLERTVRRLEHAEEKLKREQALRHELIKIAAAQGVSLPVIARVASLSLERVRHVVAGDPDFPAKFLAAMEEEEKS